MYDYRLAMENDIVEALDELAVYEGLDISQYVDENGINDIYDALWVNDSVTGNASGSYTFCRDTAAEYISENWDLMLEALEAFGLDGIPEEPEYIDVTIRCYLLSEVLDTVINTIC